MNDDKPGSPFPGLRPFFEVDAPYFFGRDQERRIISANLRTQRLTLLYGPSGVGKTSVIHAGVMSHLRKHTASGAGRPAGTRVETAPYRKPVIAIVLTKWQANPLDALRHKILSGANNLFSPSESDRLGNLPLPRMIEEITTLAADAEVLVVLDQFEGYFVYHSEDEIAKKFDHEFSCVLTNQDLRANFLISIREDWLARLDRFKARIPNLFDNTLRIEHLKHNAAGDAIRGPIVKYNELTARASPRRTAVVTDEFVEQTLKQLEQLDQTEEDDLDLKTPRPSGLKSSERCIRTTRLQIVLEDLWKKVRESSSPKLGVELLPRADTVRTIIESHLNESLAHLGRKESTIAAHFFPLLTTVENAKFADSATNLAKKTVFTAEEIRGVLKRLSADDLKILDRVAPSAAQPGELRYEFTSDALATHVLAWSRKIRTEELREEARIKARAKIGSVAAVIGSIAGAIIIVVVSIALNKALTDRRLALSQAEIIKQQRDIAQRVLDGLRRLDRDVPAPYSKAVLRSHGQKVTSAVFTPDGHVLTASADGSAILWNVDSMLPIHEFNKNEKKENPLICAAVSPKGSMMVTASADGSLTLWDLGSGVIKKQLNKQHHVTAISFSRDGNFIAAGNTVGEVVVWNTQTGAPVKQVPGKDSNHAITQLAFSPNDTFLAAASFDATVYIWRAADWTDANSLVGHTGKVNGLGFSADEKYIATAGADGTVRVWDPANGALKRVFLGNGLGINSVDFDKKDSNRLLSASDDATARIWNVERSKSIELIGHTDKVLSASFSPSGQQVVTASKDHVVRIWSASTGTNLVELKGHADEVTYVTYSADGRYILTASDDMTARVWYALEIGKFVVEQPTIQIDPKNYDGPCPVTVSFTGGVHVSSGSGIVAYDLLISGARQGPTRELAFDEPGTKYVKLYRSIGITSSGSAIIEVIDPQGIRPEKASFNVVCKKNGDAAPTPSPPDLK